MKTKTTNENLVNNSNQPHKKEDLYRVTYIQIIPLRSCDFDGIPLDLVYTIISDINGSKNVKKLRVKYLDEDELKQPTHKSVRCIDGIEYKTIGDFFHSNMNKRLVEILRKKYE